ncbi:MAG: 1-deoxy-D-xylulose-5-phosphate synthase, partial [Bacteroidia bacterium]|nr:1-deoxy-D-xylulose-5-phosphate synthase [Bacteroidia bacterium]
GVMVNWRTPLKEMPIGKGKTIQEGKDIAILSIGTAGNLAIDAVKKLKEENINIGLYDMRFVKPIDEDILHQVCKQYKKIITVEDGTIVGGFGSAVLEFIAKFNYDISVSMLGMPDSIVEHGEQPELYKECGYDANSIIKNVKKLLLGKVLI